MREQNWDFEEESLLETTSHNTESLLFSTTPKLPTDMLNLQQLIKEISMKDKLIAQLRGQIYSLLKKRKLKQSLLNQDLLRRFRALRAEYKKQKEKEGEVQRMLEDRFVREKQAIFENFLKHEQIVIQQQRECRLLHARI